MDTQISFSLGDFGMLILWMLIVTLLVLVIMILFRFYKSFKQLMSIVDDNRPNIDKVLNEAPDLTKNVNTIVGEVAHGTQVFRDTVDNVASTTSSITGAIKDNSGIVDFLTSIFSIGSAVKNGMDRVFKEKTKDDIGSNPSKGQNDSHEADHEENDPQDDMKSWDMARDTVKQVADSIPHR